MRIENIEYSDQKRKIENSVNRKNVEKKKIQPPVITDFKKTQTKKLEKNKKYKCIGTTDIYSRPKAILDIEWIIPEKKKNLSLVEEFYHSIDGFDAGNFEYYLVGRVHSGKYKHGNIVVAVADEDAPNKNTIGWIFRFLVHEKKIILLERYSDSAECPIFNTDVSSQIFIPELQFPEIIYGNSPNQILTLRQQTHVFHDSKNSQKILYTNKKLGNIYEDDDFYIIAKDGTKIDYSLYSPFLSQVSIDPLQITWNDGEENSITYDYYGNKKYIWSENLNIVPENMIDTNFLMDIGKTREGETIYGFTDQNNDFFRSITHYKMGDNLINSHEKKFTLKTIIFWRDPFHRLIQLMDADAYPG